MSIKINGKVFSTGCDDHGRQSADGVPRCEGSAVHVETEAHANPRCAPWEWRILGVRYSSAIVASIHGGKFRTWNTEYDSNPIVYPLIFWKLSLHFCRWRSVDGEIECEVEPNARERAKFFKDHEFCITGSVSLIVCLRVENFTAKVLFCAFCWSSHQFFLFRPSLIYSFIIVPSISNW